MALPLEEAFSPLWARKTPALFREPFEAAAEIMVQFLADIHDRWGCQLEMLNLWGTPMTDTVNAWTCKFAMNQADINNDWDTYVAEVEAQNMQNIVDMYNDTYNASK